MVVGPMARAEARIEINQGWDRNTPETGRASLPRLWSGAFQADRPEHVQQQVGVGKSVAHRLAGRPQLAGLGCQRCYVAGGDGIMAGGDHSQQDLQGLAGARGSVRRSLPTRRIAPRFSAP